VSEDGADIESGDTRRSWWSIAASGRTDSHSRESACV
jgi:hypothetical protein